MIEQILTISRNTFTESIRQPIYLVLIGLGILLLVLNPMISAYTIDDDNVLMVDQGLSMIALACLLLAAFTATAVFAAELDSKTVLTVISKPVTRPAFVLGKFFGVAAAIAMAFVILTIVFLLTVRHGVMQTASDHFDPPVLTFSVLAAVGAAVFATAANYFYRWVFTSTLSVTLAILLTIAYLLVLLISPQWQFQAISTELLAYTENERNTNLPQLLIALLLVFESAILFVAVAIAATTRLRQVMTLVVCAAFAVVGMLNHSIFAPWARDYTWQAVDGPVSAASWFFVRVFHGLMPDLQILWIADALKQAHVVPTTYVLTVSTYCLLYVVALLLLAVALFQSREVG